MIAFFIINISNFFQTAMVKLLLAHGANGTIRSSGRDWQSPLHSALTDACRPDIVLMLMEKGAKPEDRDGNGKSAIDYPTNRDCHNQMYERSQKKRDWDILMERAREGQKILKEMANEAKNEKDVLKRLELMPKYLDRLMAPYRPKNETQNLQKKGNHQ
jgi:ankyrin repeat protein